MQKSQPLLPLVISRTKLITYTIVILLLSIFYFDGMIGTLLHIAVEPGEWNPIVAPATLILFGVIWLLYQLLHQQVRISPLIVLGGIASLINIYCTLKSGYYSKGFRDLCYLWLLVFSYLDLRELKKQYGVNFRQLSRYLVIIGVILVPITTFYWGIGYNVEGRFTALVGSAPIFANGLFLLTALALSSKLPFYWIILCIVTSMFFIVPNGTRSPLLLFGVLVIYAWVANKNTVKFNKLFVLISAIFAIIVLYWATNGFSTGNRVISINDIQAGSLKTRMTIYITVWEQLSTTMFIGGAGAGVSEKLFDYLTHFDFLRYWYDYSILYLLLFLAILYYPTWSNKTSRSLWKIKKQFIWNISFFTISILLLSFHNYFAIPFGVIMVALWGHVLFKESSSDLPKFKSINNVTLNI